MKIAIVQPYVFPYIGYFQLISAVDAFVFYDDVNFIKRGWINRNKILLNQKEKLISIPLSKASQNKLINEIKVNYSKEYYNLFTTIKNAYRKAPYFDDCIGLVEEVLMTKYESIGDLSQASIRKTFLYLGIEKKFLVSSHDFPSTRNLERADRLIEITKALGGNVYVNPMNGSSLYSKEYFRENSIQLEFIQPIFSEYKQLGGPFLQGLSMIDVLMFNSTEDCVQMFNNYKFLDD